MRQSEFKKNLELEQQEKTKESNRFWSNLAKKPHTYKNMICKNIKYTFGGIENTGVHGMCWYCDKCGRSGCNYQNLRKIDKLIEEVCDLEEG